MAKTKALLKDEDLKPENIKSNITIRMPLDLLDAYRERADELGIGYQTLMQMTLRRALDTEDIVADDNSRLVRRLENLERLIGSRALPLRSPTRKSSKRGTTKRAR